MKHIHRKFFNALCIGVPLIVIIALFVALTGCGTRAELGVGYADSIGNRTEHKWEGTAPAVTFRLRREFETAVPTGCQYQHVSNLADGWPFNDRSESSLDMVECFVSIPMD